MLASVEKRDVSFPVTDGASDVPFLGAILRVVADVAAVKAEPQLVGDCDSLRQ